MPLPRINRLRRVFTKQAIPPWLITGWAALDAASNIDFVRQDGAAVLKFLVTPAGNLLVLVIGLAWLVFLAMRPENKLDRVKHLRRLLLEAAKTRREWATDKGSKLDRIENIITQEVRMLLFLQTGFSHRVWPDYQAFMKAEEEKLRAANKWNAHEAAARYLERLASRLTVDDIDEGFHLPDSLEQYRPDAWPVNVR